MTRALGALATGVIRDLIRGLESRSLAWPPTSAELRRLGVSGSTSDLAEELDHLAKLGTPAAAVCWAFRAVVGEREWGREATDRLELVWTGPEVPGSRSRDTGVVVRELLGGAEKSVLISTYVIYQGRQLFEPLAARMKECPGLSVRLFVHVERPYRDETPENQLLKTFAENLRNQWPGTRLPHVYYDCRSLALKAKDRASLHAKCIVVDDRRCFVSSANFTEAAQERNVEAGVLVDDRSFAASLRAQFDALVASGDLRRVPGLESEAQGLDSAFPRPPGSS